MPTIRRLILGWYFLLCLAGDLAVPGIGTSAPSFRDLEGCWKEEVGERLVCLESRRLVQRERGRTSAVTILERHQGRLTVRNQGLSEIWNLSLNGSLLRIERRSSVVEYGRLPGRPGSLSLTPTHLGRSVFISPERRKAVEAELVRRRDLDQRVRTVPAERARWGEVDADNFSYLKELVREVGWIDVKRFGKPASWAAVLIAKHSSDPCLLQAALPLVERDLRSGAVSPELFSLLYDETQLNLGKKQKFGTQLNEDEKGPYVLPLENARRVDEYRKRIGLPPVASYLADASQALFGGKRIRFRQE